MQKQPATLEEVQALYETVRQLERALEAKHKEFIEQRARASYYKMLFEDAKLKQVQWHKKSSTAYATLKKQVQTPRSGTTPKPTSFIP